MKEYANKFPKAFDDVRSKILQISNIEWDGNCFVCWGYDDNGRYPATEIPECMVRGWLIEEYFPKHGIEIMRDMKYSNIKGFESHYRIHDKRYTYDTPEEAILKAFEIREKQLEGK